MIWLLWCVTTTSLLNISCEKKLTLCWTGFPLGLETVHLVCAGSEKHTGSLTTVNYSFERDFQLETHWRVEVILIFLIYLYSKCKNLRANTNCKLLLDKLNGCQISRAHISGRQTPGLPPYYITNAGGKPRVKPWVWCPEMLALVNETWNHGNIQDCCSEQ
jgi:hypothetical protein